MRKKLLIGSGSRDEISRICHPQYYGLVSELEASLENLEANPSSEEAQILVKNKVVATYTEFFSLTQSYGEINKDSAEDLDSLFGRAISLLPSGADLTFVTQQYGHFNSYIGGGIDDSTDLE